MLALSSLCQAGTRLIPPTACQVDMAHLTSQDKGARAVANTHTLARTECSRDWGLLGCNVFSHALSFASPFCAHLLPLHRGPKALLVGVLVSFIWCPSQLLKAGEFTPS